MIKNIKEIINKDLRAMFKNPVVTVVLIALIILPSLYSIVNIYSCWDPYEDTDNMEFIIVNNDNPVTVNGTTYDYGSKVVSSLQENDKFNWIYKDEDEARDLIKNGSNYAAIIIPAGFTEDILSVQSGNPQQATIQYITNDKTSPVAPKITSNAANKVNNEISDSIMEQYAMQNYQPVVAQQAAAAQMAQSSAAQSANQTTANAQANAQMANQTASAQMANQSTAAQATNQSISNAQSYFHSPTVLSNYSYYEADNYGQQVTPFYTALALWVGCIILIALLSTTAGKDEEKYRPVEVYLGKLGLFAIMNILQTVVMFIALNLLGVTMVDPTMTFISMFIIGLSFMILTYTLVSLFGNVGKAIAIIILVFQISGTNGIYPIQIMAPALQSLIPFLPMTYAIAMLKDAIFGIIWPSFIGNVTCLLIFPIAAIILGFIAKEKLDKNCKYANKKLEESDIFQ
ncbi:MAG: YhgE/Pip family protein [Methanosphaera sp.]|uniref:YhgE/Pip domain-containing protein n=1 Tax=Methanosphaera sp. TaxID=2666342 RepID=UPI0026100D8E|nr:YhgE/Pip family protein [Methanosphaera sp.]MDD6534772.1 YhgE/Pip family protein [Methanosphaera sp.]